MAFAQQGAGLPWTAKLAAACADENPAHLDDLLNKTSDMSDTEYSTFRAACLQLLASSAVDRTETVLQPAAVRQILWHRRLGHWMIPTEDTEWWRCVMESIGMRTLTPVLSVFVEACATRDGLQAMLSEVHLELLMAAAIRSGDLPQAQQLLALPVYDGFIFGQALLHTACERDARLPLVQWMLSLPSDQRPDVNCAESPVIHEVCAANAHNILQYLLSLSGDQQVDVHLSDEGCTSISADRGHPRCLQQLLELQGARQVNVNARNGQIWLGACAVATGPACMQLLLDLPSDRGLDVHARDGAALTWAAESRCGANMRVLLSLQGDRKLDVHAGGEKAFVAAVGWDAPAVADVLMLHFDPPAHLLEAGQEAELDEFFANVLHRRLSILEKCTRPWLESRFFALLLSGPAKRCGTTLHNALQNVMQRRTAPLSSELRSCYSRFVWSGCPHLVPRLPRRAMVLRRAKQQRA